MATNPLATFLTNFNAAYGGVASARPDRLREIALAQDMIRYQDAAPQRAANLDMTRTQTEVMQHNLQQARRQSAQQLFGEAEMRANELGGLTNALDDPVFQQRLTRSVNMLAGDESGMQMVGFERMNRQNAEQWGMPVNAYEQLLTEHNPAHVPGTDDDEVLVPVFRHPDGSVGPADTSGDGQIEAWSAQEAMEFIRGQFVTSDEVAGALGSLNTGQPGGTAGSTGGAGTPRDVRGLGTVTPIPPPREQLQTLLAPPPELDSLIQQSAQQHGVPVSVLRAIAHQESTYGRNRFNKKSGARGVMQYIPETAGNLGIDPENDAQAIDAAAMQIRQRLDAGESLEEAIAHHFAGPDRGGWKENTQTYVNEVLGKVHALEGSSAVAIPDGRAGQAGTQAAVSPEAMVSAGQVATPATEPAPGAQVELQTFEPDVERNTLEQQKRQLRRQLRDDPDNQELKFQLDGVNAQISEFEEFDKLWDLYSDGDAAKSAASNLPIVPGESAETALGVPRDQIPDNASRGARRVAEGKGISPAQAKELALNPEQLPQPSNRAAVAAGAAFLGGLEPQGAQYTVSGGRRPTHKQLTTAVVLTRAGFLDSDALTRYADLGVVSSDGVSIIQTGMNNAAQTQRQAMADRRAVMQTELQQIGQTQRTAMQQAGQDRRLVTTLAARAGVDAPTMEQIIGDNETAFKNVFRARNVPEDVAEERARVLGARLTEMGLDSRVFREGDWTSGQLARSMAELHEFDRRYNESRGIPQGIVNLGRLAAGRPVRIEMSANPLAIMLHAEGSELMNVEEQSFLGRDRVPAFVSAIEDPMNSVAKQMGMEGVLAKGPEHQRRIFDAAAVGLRAEMADTGDRSILNDNEAISEAVLEATRVYLDTMTRAGQ